MRGAGIPYFPLDAHLDEKWELIEAEFGLKGFAVVVKLLQRIYGQNGYYCEWTNEVALLFGKQCGLGDNVVSEIVASSIKRGLFDKTLFDNYGILTSKGIQKRYFDAVSRRISVEVKKEYLLINVDHLPKNVRISSENVNISFENDSISEQSNNTRVLTVEDKKESTIRANASCTVDSIFSDYAGDDETLLSALEDFKAMRKQIKKPLSERAAKMIVKELDELNKKGNPPVQVLEQSILHCWQGVFELKGDRSYAGNGKYNGNAEDISGEGWNVGRRV